MELLRKEPRGCQANIKDNARQARAYKPVLKWIVTPLRSHVMSGRRNQKSGGTAIELGVRISM